MTRASPPWASAIPFETSLEVHVIHGSSRAFSIASKLDKEAKPSDNVQYASEGWQTIDFPPADRFSVPRGVSDLDGLGLLTVQGKSICRKIHL